ncbi:bZIP transcription factor 27-like [Tasmannia lanceolata]|uniref:bZIP transcription factor 27-like n=1 Tax=Tasmannia lanceolata TaxID=3420 RepID=UPI004062BED4
MWSSLEENNFRVSPFSSKSSSSSSPSHSPSYSILPKKTMEEVWKDINLNSLQDKPNIDHSPKNSFRRTILQEFLARPFKEPPASAIDPPDLDISLFSSTPVATPPPTATALSLNSSPEFQYLEPMSFQHNANSHTLPSRRHPQCFAGNDTISTLLGSPFDAIGSSSSSLRKKRLPDLENSNTDRRHKRMIKNRESAARSRARKQAYTNELEIEKANLLEENAKLKQQQEFCLAAHSHIATKKTLCRTSTAPF